MPTVTLRSPRFHNHSTHALSRPRNHEEEDHPHGHCRLRLFRLVPFRGRSARSTASTSTWSASIRSTREGGKAYAQKRGIRFFDRLDALLDEVDVIHVCVPPVAHEPVSIAGLKRDKFVDLREAADRLLRRRLAGLPRRPVPQAGGPGRRAGQRRPHPGGRGARARAGCSTPRTGSTPRRSRRSARSSRRPAARSCGSTARRPTAARTRWTTPSGAAAAAA